MAVGITVQTSHCVNNAVRQTVVENKPAPGAVRNVTIAPQASAEGIMSPRPMFNNPESAQ